MSRATAITCCRSAEPSSPCGVPTAMKTMVDARTASSQIGRERQALLMIVAPHHFLEPWLVNAACARRATCPLSTDPYRRTRPCSRSRPGRRPAQVPRTRFPRQRFSFHNKILTRKDLNKCASSSTTGRRCASGAVPASTPINSSRHLAAQKTARAVAVFEFMERPTDAATADLRGVRIRRSAHAGLGAQFFWHRLGWPPAEMACRRAVRCHPLVASADPALAGNAAHVVTIHDLNFLTIPNGRAQKCSRDYPALAREHAHRAHRILVPSEFTAGEVVRQLGVARSKVAVCPRRRAGVDAADPLASMMATCLFVGTLEPRKNVGGSARCLRTADCEPRRSRAPQRTQRRQVPDLVLAGK